MHKLIINYPEKIISHIPSHKWNGLSTSYIFHGIPDKPLELGVQELACGYDTWRECWVLHEGAILPALLFLYVKRGFCGYQSKNFIHMLSVYRI